MLFRSWHETSINCSTNYTVDKHEFTTPFQVNYFRTLHVHLIFARAAAKEGWNVTAPLAEGEPKTTDAITNFERLHSLSVNICADCTVLETQHFDVVVDALYGTGFHGALRPSGLAACGLMNRLHKSGAFVLAVDLPSGINTDTGEVAEGAAHADLTVTFDSYKPLHVAESSAPLCGKIVCSDIGIRDEWHPEF